MRQPTTQRGERIVTASEDETAKVWDAESGEELLTLRGHTNWVNFSGLQSCRRPHRHGQL